MGDETEVVDVEKDSEEGQDVRVRESQVGMVTLDGVNEVDDVETPKEGRKTTVFRQSFEDLDVRGEVETVVEWWRMVIRAAPQCWRKWGVRPDSPGDLSLWEWCEVPKGPGRDGMWAVRAEMVKGVSEGQW